jgi:Fe-S cluster assembly protein SufB
VREYFATIIPAADNKFAALNSAVWSGGSFVYVPAGVHVDIPLQAYFRINAQNMGQFERTLIIVEEGASVHYVEGCTAPIYSSNSLHSAVVEIIVKKGARCRYTTIQNWSTDVYNLVTKRAVAYEGATMEWIDGNLGSKVTMKYPAVYMLGPKAPRRDSVDRLRRPRPAPGRRRQGRPRRAFHQLQDRLQVDLQGWRPRLLPRSAQGGQGRAPQQEQRRLRRAAAGRGVAAPTPIRTSRSRKSNVSVGHEASVSKIGEEQLFYLHEPRHRRRRSGSHDRRRLYRAAGQGTADGVRGGDEPVIQLQMEGSIG